MITIVIVHFDVLENGKGLILKADVMASLLKQLNDLGVTLVVQTKDSKKIAQFFDAHLRNPSFIATDNILVYTNSRDRLDGLKNWVKANDKKVIKPNEKTPIYQVYMMDKKVDMSAALLGRNTQFIKVNGSDDHIKQLNEVVVALKRKIEEERKLKLKNLDAEIAKLHEGFANDSMLKFTINKLNQVEIESMVISAIIKVLEKLKDRSSKPGDIPDLSCRDDEAAWQEVMLELVDHVVKERIDKAESHNGLMGSVENFVWVKGTDREALAKYKQWLKQTAEEIIAKCRADFVKTTKEPGMTLEKLTESYESLLDKKSIERINIQCVCQARVDELSKPSSNLESERLKVKADFLFASTSSTEFLAAAKDIPETASAEDINNPSVFTVCGGSQIMRRRLSVRLGSSLYEPDIQTRILADLKATIAKNNNFDVNAADNKSRALLHIACRKGLSQVVEYLIKEKGANVDLAIQPLGLSPIFHAIHFVTQHPNQTKVLELLLEAGASVSGKVKNIDGLTALSVAATIGEGDNNAFVVELLLKFAMQRLSKNVESVQRTVSKNEASAAQEKLASEANGFKLLEKKLPMSLQLGAAIYNDSFFDAFAKALNDAVGNQEYSIKSLRLLCDEYIKNDANEWVKIALLQHERGAKGYYDYLARIPFTAEEMEEHDKQKSLIGIPVWSSPDIDGRIICDVLKINLHVIEIPEQAVEVSQVKEYLVTGQKTVAIEPMKSEAYMQANLVHLVVHKNHFVPLLKTVPNKPLAQVKEQSQNQHIDVFVSNSNGRTTLLEAAFAKKDSVVGVFCKYGIVFTLADIEALTADHSQVLLKYKKFLENCMVQFGIKPESPKCGSPTKFSALLSPKRKNTKEVAPIVPLQHPCFAQLPSLLEKYNLMADSPNGRSGSDISQYRSSRSASFSEKLLPTFLKSPSMSNIPVSKLPTDSKEPPVVGNVNELDAQGYADIHKACIIGHMGLFNELCKRSAKLNIKSKEGFTPLFYAITYGQPDLAEKLLNKQDVELEILPDGNTLLHTAVYAQDVRTVVNLITKAKQSGHSTYIFQPNKKDNTALMEAILSGKREIIDAFLQNGIWLSEMDQQNLIIIIEGKSNKDDIKSVLGEVLKKQIGLIDGRLEDIAARKHDAQLSLVPK